MKKQKKIAGEASPKAEDLTKSEDNCKVVDLQKSYKKMEQKKFIKFIIENSKSF